MSWNYRLVRRVCPFPDGTTEDYFGIYEVYYDAACQPTTISAEPMPVSAETVEGVQWILQKMAEAMQKPLLEYAMFESKGEARDQK